MIADEKISMEKMRQFAEQWDKLTPGDKKLINESFRLNERVDFYCGLLAGFAAIYQMLNHPVPELGGPVPPELVKKFVGGSISHLSRYIKEKVEG